MKIKDFALFGARPKFDKPLPVGQLYFPSWERYELAFRGIFQRNYYNNNGPLHEKLEDKLQQYLNVKNAICVSNATLGLMIVADAMELYGKIILPAFTFVGSAQSLLLAGLKPVFCDVDLKTHQIAIDNISALIDKDVSAIMGVNLWGGACEIKALSELTDTYGVQLYFDSAHSFGCSVDGIKIGNFGRAEVFSFHATKILSSTEGGCICTNDDNLAERIRSIRPSYGNEHPVEVDRVANARMSEAQAAIGLMSLEDFEKNQQNNETLYKYYESKLASIPGVHLVKPTGVNFSNYQYVVCMIDELEYGLSRDVLINLLKAENIITRRYFYPGLHKTNLLGQNLTNCNNFPNTDSICEACLQLPIGAPVSVQNVERISDIIYNAHHLAADIRELLRR